jgi:hypothetical protein
MPSTSPLSTERLTPSTARAMPWGEEKDVRRLRMSSSSVKRVFSCRFCAEAIKCERSENYFYLPIVCWDCKFAFLIDFEIHNSLPIAVLAEQWVARMMARCIR